MAVEYFNSLEGPSDYQAAEFLSLLYTDGFYGSSM
jgi:hypothetical protein